MSQVCHDEGETAETLLIDVTNTFNQMNRAAAMHNIQITCPIKYVINTFQSLQGYSFVAVERFCHWKVLLKVTH